MKKHHIYAGLMIILYFASLSPVLAQECADFSKQINVAYRIGDVAQAGTVFRRMEIARVCSGGARTMLGRFVALAYVKAARHESGQPKARLLKKALEYGRPWQALASLGDFEKGHKNFSIAAIYYQEALNDITDTTSNPKAPKQETIAAIHKKAVIARALAKDYVKVTKNRSGAPGGLARIRFRGFSVRAIPAPVQFEYDRAVFTPKGQRAVADMLGYLNAQGAPDIHLIGHTDHKGSAHYNLKLSQRRAGAVKAWLIAQGYRGNIRTSGQGESAPFKLDDPGLYTSSEKDQLNRRVEIVRDQAQ